MNKQHDPKTNTGQKPDQQKNAREDSKSNLNENFKKGHEQSGYAEKEPKKKPDDPGHQPKVTNEDNDITNADQQNRIDEEPVNENAPGKLSDNKDPEIDTPIYDPEKTEKKIPSIKK